MPTTARHALQPTKWQHVISRRWLEISFSRGTRCSSTPTLPPSATASWQGRATLSTRLCSRLSSHHCRRSRLRSWTCRIPRYPPHRRQCGCRHRCLSQTGRRRPRCPPHLPTALTPTPTPCRLLPPSPQLRPASAQPTLPPPSWRCPRRRPPSPRRLSQRHRRRHCRPMGDGGARSSPRLAPRRCTPAPPRSPVWREARPTPRTAGPPRANSRSRPSPPRSRRRGWACYACRAPLPSGPAGQHRKRTRRRGTGRSGRSRPRRSAGTSRWRRASSTRRCLLGRPQRTTIAAQRKTARTRTWRS